MAFQRLVCPHCGAEYIPSEIFMGDEFLEEPTSLSKGKDGRIVATSGQPAQLEATYVCDFCDTEFTVRASVSFGVVPEEDFLEETSIAI